MVTFRVLQFQQPSYPASLILPYVPTRALCSSSSLSICVPPAPTISLGSHQNIGLHTGARANVVLLTYLLTYVKPLWQPPNHFHLLLQVFGMHCQIICRPSQLFQLLEELSNIIYSCLLTLTVVQNLVRSNQLNASHFVIQCKLLPSHSPETPCHPSERLRLVK